MTLFVKPTGGGHWYTKDGEPRHDATLREARKEKLFPSPTSVLNTMHSAALERWKINQSINAALELPRAAGEDDDSYGRRVGARADVLRKSAANLGTQIHDGVDRIIGWRRWDTSCPILQRFSDWAHESILHHEWSERVLVNQKLGVAGRADACVSFKGKAAEVVGTDEPVLVDWKTQGMKLSKTKNPVYKPNWYPKWVMQLAFYSSCLMSPTPVVSVAINTTEPGEPLLKRWTDEEQSCAMVAFEAALALWSYDNNYNPLD